MPDYTQAGKSMRVSTPLPADTLLLERISGEEGVSKPFELTLDLLSQDAAIDPKKLLRKSISVAVDLPGGGKRFFHGQVRRFVQLGRADGLVGYRAEVVPALWFLSLTSDCRIFQAKSVPDIAKKVLDEMGVKDVQVNLTGSYPAREFCVQYRESHLSFLSRLFEEEGIFYFFVHTADKETLVLADSPSGVKPGPTPRLSVSLVEVGGAADGITELELGSEVCSGKVTLVDYNDTVPKRLESTVSGGTEGTSVEQLRVFDYPGKFSVVGEGDRLARLRMEAHEATSKVVRGRTTSRGLASGHKLEIADHYRRDVNQLYHLLTVTHRGRVGSYRHDGHDTGDPAFESTFVAIPHAVPFRPAQVTPKSLVHGSQTAVVVGPANEEIHVDKFGRVKVKFFWDQANEHDDKSSCWVRVSSTWAGKNWGFVNIPRIGQEVIVDFLEGDPDRPIITGRVYNADQMPPYALPASGTQSGLKTRSSKGGDSATANELRFEDKKGNEEELLHAEKDLNTVVEHDDTRNVGHDRKIVIKNADTRTVSEGNDTLTVEKGDQSITVSKGKQTVTVDQNRVVTIRQGSDTLSIKMGDLTTEISQGNHTTKLNVGSVAVKCGAGGIKHEAMQGIELKVGQNSVKIDQSGITIKGMMVKIEGQIQTELKGMMTTVKGDGMLTVKGGITMIN